MKEDDHFTPRIGRLRSRGDSSAKRYLSLVRAAIEKAKPNRFGRSSPRNFTGTRIGRGAGVGHVAAWRGSPFDRLRTRRVVIKLRIAKIGAKGLPAARAHLKYIERDGVARDGSRGGVYDDLTDRADSHAFIERADGDRHQFRLIVAPEDADELTENHGDLKGFTREFMARAERDLGTKLDWIAVDHFDTDHAHTHIVIRGKDARGQDLVIARDYITHGLRGRASAIAQDWLGPRPDRDIVKMQAREVQVERFTGLDRDLVAGAKDDVVTIGGERRAYARFRRALLIGRLKKLERLGLAVKEPAQRWRLSRDLEPTLRRLGERGDIIRTMQRALGASRETGWFAIFDPVTADQSSLLGGIVATGAADETRGTRFIIIDATDSRQWYVEIGKPEEETIPPVGAIVTVEPSRATPKAADRTINAIAHAHDGRYSGDLHAAHDPTASREFRNAHIRRLEALRRVGIVTRESDGSWRVPDDYLDHAAAFEARRIGTRLKVLSWVPLKDLAERRSMTWLDSQIEEGRFGESEAVGFGGALHDAVTRRRAWLLAQGFAAEKAARVTIDRTALSRLTAAEVEATGARLAAALGKTYAPALDGLRVEGAYTRAINLASGRYAMLERSKEFTLVPWRNVIEPRRGQAIAALVRGESVQWAFGRQRGHGIG